MKTGVAVAFALAFLLALVGCAPPGAGPSTRLSNGVSRPAPPSPTLATAIRNSARLGPAGESTTVSLSFALRVRDPKRLAGLIESGKTVTPAAYAAEFGPDPGAAKA